LVHSKLLVQSRNCHLQLGCTAHFQKMDANAVEPRSRDQLLPLL
jgi:hypothetical protein